jgi:hypothetical protein
MSPDQSIGDNVASDPRRTAKRKVEPGKLISDCKLDLPSDDIVERIGFERFFALNAHISDFDPPITINLRIDNPASRSKVNDLDGASAETKTGLERLMPGFLDRMRPIFKAVAGKTDGDPPPDYQSYQLALYMPFEQTWHLRGYTLGRPVNSITVEPSAQKTIETYTWDRQTSSFESTSSTDVSQSTQSSSTRRDTSDVSSEITNQAGFELSTSGKVGFQVGVVSADLQAGASARSSVNDQEKSTRGSINEATSQSTNTIRTTRTLKVTETQETGREDRVTTVLNNPNHFHTLTVIYFEILANYRIDTKVKVDELALVMLMPATDTDLSLPITRATIREHETVLRMALLDPALAAGFDAAQLLESRDRACAILCQSCECDTAPPPASADTPERQAAVSAAQAVAKSVATISKYSPAWPLSIGGAAVNDPNAIADVDQHLMLSALADAAPSFVNSVMALGLANATVSDNQLVNLNAVISAITPDRLALLSYDKSVSDEASNEAEAALGGPLLPPWHFFMLYTNSCKNYADAGLVAAIQQFSGPYQTWQAQVAATTAANANAAELARVAEQERQERILQAYGLRELADAQERLDALLTHMMDKKNVDHYRFAIANERNDTLDSDSMRLALMGICDPVPIGTVDNKLALKVRLDYPPFVSLQQFFNDAVVDIIDDPPNTTQENILPTPALYAEALLGECQVGESYAIEQAEADVKTAMGNADIAKFKAERMKRRLDADLLDPAPKRYEFKVSERLDEEVDITRGAPEGPQNGT